MRCPLPAEGGFTCWLLTILVLFSLAVVWCVDSTVVPRGHDLDEPLTAWFPTPPPSLQPLQPVQPHQPPPPSPAPPVVNDSDSGLPISTGALLVPSHLSATRPQSTRFDVIDESTSTSTSTHNNNNDDGYFIAAGVRHSFRHYSSLMQYAHALPSLHLGGLHPLMHRFPRPYTIDRHDGHDAGDQMSWNSSGTSSNTSKSPSNTSDSGHHRLPETSATRYLPIH